MKTGVFSYSCWMGMIRSSITVVEEGQSAAESDEPNLATVSAGVTILTDVIALAEIRQEGYQMITTNLRDEGIDPAVIAVQRGVPVEWTIRNNSLDPGNSPLIFPAYYTKLNIGQGDTVIRLISENNFYFSTGDNIFYGYVKVVDDLAKVDLAKVKAEVSGFETMIYPDAYFETAAQGGCCGQ